MSEEMFIGVPDDDLPRCPTCGKTMIWYRDTLLCVKCSEKDRTLAVLNWQKELEEENKK